MKYPDNETVAYAYNSRMLLNTVIGTNSYVASTGYDSAGRITSRALGNTRTQAFTYHPWNIQGGRLQNITTGTLQNLTYTYDSVGNIKTITDVKNASQKQCFQYDALDRLTNATTYSDTPQGCTTQLGQGNYNEGYSYDDATGNLKTKAGVTLNYPTGVNPARPHAVTGTDNATTATNDDNSYVYDANGNMITCTVLSPTVQNPNNKDVFNLSYDAENRLTQVKKNNVTIATFVYDGDGKRVKSVMGSETILFIGAHYEVTNPGSLQTVTKYYFAGTSRIAMRTSGTLTYLLTDHLNSTSITTNSSGGLVSELRYKPWGETRYSSGTTSTKYQYTGQYSYASDFGLLFYNARFYDSYLNHFTQPDTIVPDPTNPQDWDRYSYARNNPVKYTDPTGHDPWWNDPLFDLENYISAGIFQQSACQCNIRKRSLVYNNWLIADPSVRLT